MAYGITYEGISKMENQYILALAGKMFPLAKDEFRQSKIRDLHLAEVFRVLEAYARRSKESLSVR